MKVVCDKCQNVQDLPIEGKLLEVAGKMMRNIVCEQCGAGAKSIKRYRPPTEGEPNG